MLRPAGFISMSSTLVATRDGGIEIWRQPVNGRVAACLTFQEQDATGVTEAYLFQEFFKGFWSSAQVSDHRYPVVADLAPIYSRWCTVSCLLTFELPRRSNRPWHPHYHGATQAPWSMYGEYILAWSKL